MNKRISQERLNITDIFLCLILHTWLQCINLLRGSLYKNKQTKTTQNSQEETCISLLSQRVGSPTKWKLLQSINRNAIRLITWGTALKAEWSNPNGLRCPRINAGFTPVQSSLKAYSNMEKTNKPCWANPDMVQSTGTNSWRNAGFSGWLF